MWIFSDRQVQTGLNSRARKILYFCFMFVRDHFVSYRDSQLHYAKGGHGPRRLLLFHGFGQNFQVFHTWVTLLENDFTLYAFDLYFHGDSSWPARTAVEKSDWKIILDQFLTTEQIDRFEVGGFSMGGKFALVTLALFAHRVERLVLIAPDGIKTSFWYSLATYPIATRALFRSMIIKPNRLFRIIRALRALRLVDNGLLRFAELQMNTLEKRKRVYFSWVYFRHLKFDRSNIRRLLNTGNIPFLVITGRFDRIITTRNMEAFARTITRHRLIELDAGHTDLVEKAAAVGALQTFR